MSGSSASVGSRTGRGIAGLVVLVAVVSAGIWAAVKASPTTVTSEKDQANVSPTLTPAPQPTRGYVVTLMAGYLADGKREPEVFSISADVDNAPVTLKPVPLPKRRHSPWRAYEYVSQVYPHRPPARVVIKARDRDNKRRVFCHIFVNEDRVAAGQQPFGWGSDVCDYSGGVWPAY